MPSNWKGWTASFVFIVAFFTLALFFLSLEPFAPRNDWLLGLWWLSVIALMAGFHRFARARTHREW